MAWHSPESLHNSSTTPAQPGTRSQFPHSLPSNPAPRQMRDTASVWDPTLRHAPSISTNDAAVAWHVMLPTGSLSSPCLCRTSLLQHAGWLLVQRMRLFDEGEGDLDRMNLPVRVPALPRMQPVAVWQARAPFRLLPGCAMSWHHDHSFCDDAVTKQSATPWLVVHERDPLQPSLRDVAAVGSAGHRRWTLSGQPPFVAQFPGWRPGGFSSLGWASPPTYHHLECTAGDLEGCFRRLCL